ADFVGSPTMNFFKMECTEKKDGSIILENDSFTLKYITENDLTGISKGNKYTLGVRPEQISSDTDKGIKGEVYSSLPSGLETVYRVNVENKIFTCVTFGGRDFEVGKPIKITFESEKHVLFDEANQRIMNGSLEVIE